MNHNQRIPTRNWNKSDSDKWRFYLKFIVDNFSWHWIKVHRSKSIAHDMIFENCAMCVIRYMLLSFFTYVVVSFESKNQRKSFMWSFGLIKNSKRGQNNILGVQSSLTELIVSESGKLKNCRHSDLIVIHWINIGKDHLLIDAEEPKNLQKKYFFFRSRNSNGLAAVIAENETTK